MVFRMVEFGFRFGGCLGFGLVGVCVCGLCSIGVVVWLVIWWVWVTNGGCVVWCSGFGLVCGGMVSSWG